MSVVGEQLDLQILSETRDRADANLDPTLTPSVANISLVQATTRLQQPVAHWYGGIDVLYRQWELCNSKYTSLSPGRLFLLFFQPILDLFVLYTNLKARADCTRKQPWKDVTDLELRRWLACRLLMIKYTPVTTSMQYLWSLKNMPSRKIGFQRFKAIERYLSLSSDSDANSKQSVWFQKVQLALDVLRTRFKSLLVPGSHLVVDESSIEFHGRKRDKYRMRHKPAGEGFVVYALCSHGGLLHDFIVSSSREGLEGVSEGVELNIPTRSMRKRKRGVGGDILCERVTAAWRRKTFACYTDNLFTDIPLAKALRTINVGLCGTTRKNTPGFPPMLLAIKHKFGPELPLNHHVAEVVDDIAVCVIWKDAERKNIVSFISTIHDPVDNESIIRRTKATLPTRQTQNGFAEVQVRQLKIAVDYNQFMGNTDLFNRLRAYHTIRRPGQNKWTKSWIGYIIDCCLINASSVRARYHTNEGSATRVRERFLDELIEGLVEDVDNTHVLIQQQKSNHCAWAGCQPQEYRPRKPLGEVTNNTTTARSSRVNTNCKACMKYLCVAKGCWARWHDDRNLILRPEEDVV